jgi:hypothetical protein
MAGRRIAVMARIFGGGTNPAGQIRFGLFVPSGGGVEINPNVLGAWTECRFLMTVPANPAGAFVYVAADVYPQFTGKTLVIDSVNLFLVPDQINAANIDQWIGSAAIGSAYISDLTATKITSGFITSQTIHLGDNNSVQLSGPSHAVAIYDQQTPQRLRFFGGKLGPNPPDYGMAIWDQNGKKYFDGISSLFAVNIGHGRERLAEAAAKQMKQLD